MVRSRGFWIGDEFQAQFSARSETSRTARSLYRSSK